jgi:polyisoprenoid-binding protein YceI
MKSLASLLFCLGLTALAGAADNRHLLLDQAHSHVEIAVKATVDSFVGHLENYEAVIEVDPAQAKIISAEFGFKFSAVKTGKTDRDEQMNTWQQTERFPGGSFKLTELTPETNGRYVAHGKLLFHGVTQELSFPVSITTDKVLYSVDGETTLDTRTFGLPIIRKFGLLKVDPLVTVRFHLQGSLPAA